MKKILKDIASITMVAVLAIFAFVIGYSTEFKNGEIKVAQISIYSLEHAMPQSSDEELLKRFKVYFETIRDEYVEEISSEELIDAAIEGMIGELDKNSSYMKPQSFRDLRQQTHGEFGGIGIEVMKHTETGYIEIVSPISDTPGARAGLKAGDLITHIDGENVTEMDLKEAVDKMRGEPAASIVLTIKREEESRDFLIIRDIIKIVAVKAQLLQNNIAHVKITVFNEHTATEVKLAVDRLRERLPRNIALSGLIIDLRNNPGGLLDQSINIADFFLDEGEIVITKGRNGIVDRSQKAWAGQIVRRSLPIVVLINKGSASASEIVTGALKDLKRATVVGTKSFGKGSVQTIISMPHGTGLRLTTQYYYTASHNKIHKIGVEPDVVVELPDGYEMKDWQVVDPQLLVATKVLLEGYNGKGPCKWVVVEDGSEDDGYGISKVCDASN